MDDVRLSKDYDNLPKLIYQKVPMFLESEEYQQLDIADRKVPGIVLAAFGRFVMRLQFDEFKQKATISSSKVLEDSYNFIELLANSHDIEIKNAIVVEFLSLLDLLEDSPRKILISRLGKETYSLYETWVK